MNSNKIAIVHDNRQIVQTLVKAFTGAGYEAVGAFTFREAVALLGGYRPALLVVNLELGEYNGLHLALRAAAEAPETKIVIIGPASAGLEEEAHAVGAASYVPRPASIDTLVAQARAAIG